MKADYDSQADAVAIYLVDGSPSDPPAQEKRVHERSGVLLVRGQPVYVDVQYPGEGIDEPLAAAAAAFDLDVESLKAAARSALAAPDRVVTLEVGAKLPA